VIRKTSFTAGTIEGIGDSDPVSSAFPGAFHFKRTAPGRGQAPSGETFVFAGNDDVAALHLFASQVELTIADETVTLHIGGLLPPPAREVQVTQPPMNPATVLASGRWEPTEITLTRNVQDWPKVGFCSEVGQCLRSTFQTILDQRDKVQNGQGADLLVVGSAPAWMAIEPPDLQKKVSFWRQEQLAFYDAELDHLRTQWSYQRGLCVASEGTDIGRLDEDTPADPEADDYKKNEKAKKRFTQVLRRIDDRILKEEYDYTNLMAAWNAFPDITLQHPESPIGATDNPARFIDWLAMRNYRDRMFALQRQRLDLQSLLEDPPSPDFAIVEQHVESEPLPDDLPPDLRDLWSSAMFQRVANANLRAYTVSFERYQGALAAVAKEAVVAQAQAMLDLATWHRLFNHLAAQARDAFLFQNLTTLDQLFAEAFSHGYRVSDHFAEFRNQCERQGLPRDWHDAALRAGYEEVDVQRLRDRVVATTWEDLAGWFLSLELECYETAAMRERLTKEAGTFSMYSVSNAVLWPPPPSSGVLLMMEYRSRRLLFESQQD
jgi:hypothetical protein